MNYTNEMVRRQDRLLPQADALQLLRTAEHGVLSMVNSDGGGYGIPVNYVWDGKRSIYFHCAPQGEKLKNLALNGSVSLCIVGHTRVVADKFTTEYESIILRGTVCLSLADSEKMHALDLILDKYSPMHKSMGLKYAEKSFHRTAVIRLDVESWSGKCKRL